MNKLDIKKSDNLEILYEEKYVIGEDVTCLTVFKDKEIINQLYGKDAKKIYKMLTKNRI